MKIVLVQPAWSDIHGEFSSLAQKHAGEPPLGIGILASLAREAGHEVSLLDAEVEQLGAEAAADRVLLGKPDIVGLSATTPIYHKAVAIAERIKYVQPGIITMVGGNHVSVLGEQALEACFDVAIRGEAESVFVDVLDELEGGVSRLTDRAGVLFRREGAARDNGMATPVHDLDGVPDPAWDLYRLDDYGTHLRDRGAVRYVTTNLTRGCPYGCVFCAAGMLEGKRIRSRSPENVVAEMRRLKESLGIDHVCFNDSTLTIKRPLIEQLCDRLIVADLGVTWEGWTRANMVDKPLLEKMVAAGFVRISFGIESGVPRILELIEKQVSHADMHQAFRWAGELGIECSCSAMMGHPGETEADVWETVRLIRSIPEIEYSPLSIAVPYPGTELYGMAERGEHGLRLLSKDYSQYLRYAGGVMEVNGMSPEDLQRLQKRALIWMHLTPRKLIGIIRRFGVGDVLRSLIGLGRATSR